VIEHIFVFESSRIRQREAPLFKEREQYLSHMMDQGVSKLRLRSVASMLLHVVRLMQLDRLRMIDLAEIQEAGLRWESDLLPIIKRGRGLKSHKSFEWTAIKWLRFHNQINHPLVPRESTDLIVDQFATFLKVTRGLSPETIRGFESRSRQFLGWLQGHDRPLSTVSLSDIDSFIEFKRNGGCRPRTIASICAALRAFFRFAEIQGWNNSRIARGIQSPRVPRYDVVPRGPKWRDVRRMLNHDFGLSRAELRAAAIISLCSIYALRSIEVINLSVKDFDWASETLTIRRAKTGRIQQFPIQFEVGEKILRYLQFGRPRCSCRRVFVTLRPPHKQLPSSGLWTIVARRMRSLGISSENFGAHALRHSCATQLLQRGSSLRDIADFLGHRDMNSVSIYAKHDVRSLKQVAAFSLAGVK
jgi:site-specific recombinase XerD